MIWILSCYLRTRSKWSYASIPSFPAATTRAPWASESIGSNGGKRPFLAIQHPKLALVRSAGSNIQNWLLGAALVVLAGLLLWKVMDSARLMGALFLWPHQLDESESMIVAETLLL